MSQTPYGLTKVFDIFKNNNLTTPMVIVKRIGQIGFIATAAGVLAIQLGSGWVYSIASAIMAYGFIIGMICFAIVAAYSSGKNRASTTAQAIGGSLLKVLLYIFLPAIIITLLLVLIFGLPQYR
jgi:heme/copper-type cytochrome/quinol oxidase subunit 2